MKLWEPDFAANFRCLAGACPDTCCKDWEIIIDEETLNRYNSLPGNFGDEVRAAMVENEEGETMFRVKNGHCPLLREDGLCRVQLALGEEGLCNTCRAHPRFYEEYGATRELTLSLSCPAAARLLLEHNAPITFICTEDSTPVTACNDLDPERYLALRQARKTAIAIAQKRQLPISDRLSLLLLFAVRLQKLLDEKAYGRLNALCTRFLDDTSCERALSRARRLRAKPASFFPCWMILNNMEHLTAEFPRLLDGCAMQSCAHALDETDASQLENLTVYFLWRYLLKASADGHVLSQAESCVFHVLCIAALFANAKEKDAASLRTTASLYSKEVEHSEENLQLLLCVFGRKTVSWRSLLAMLG